MKQIIFAGAAIFLAAVSNFAFADGTREEANYLAMVRTYGGFTRVPISQGIIIQKDGAVVYFYDSSSPTTHEPIHIKRNLMRLSNNSLSTIKSTINNLPASALRKSDPDAPMCADAPITKYSVVNSAGNELDIAKNQDCNSYVMDNNIPADEYLTNLLQSLKSVSNNINAMNNEN